VESDDGGDENDGKGVGAGDDVFFRVGINTIGIIYSRTPVPALFTHRSSRLVASHLLSSSTSHKTHDILMRYSPVRTRRRLEKIAP
jgi:hypothetical protein